MKQQHLFDKIDLQCIRTRHTLLIERSVSKTAMRLGQQPAVSVALKRLRELTGDPILVRSGTGMVPTDVGLQMLGPVSQILQSAESLFSPSRVFDPAHACETFPARRAHFGLMPRMVASSLLVLTTGRQYCQRFLQGAESQGGLALLLCPVPFPKMVYDQLWHERSHSSATARPQPNGCANR